MNVKFTALGNLYFLLCCWRMRTNPRDVKNDFQLLACTRRLLCVQLKFHAKLSFFFFEKRQRQRERERELYELYEATSARARETRKSRLLTFLCCCYHTASRWVVVVATVLCPRRSESCHYSHDETNDFYDSRCCRVMLTKYQPWDVMLVTRVRPSIEVLFHGDAMKLDVGWWTINWDWFLNARHVCMWMCSEVCERRKQMEINQTITKTR